MLNPFPSLLMYGFFAPLLLRVTVAAVFFYLAAFHMRHHAAVAQEMTMFNRRVGSFASRFLGFMEGVVALGLLLGFATQWAALLAMAISLKVFFIKRGLRHIAPLSHLSYMLLFVLSLSLLLTGAGAIAMDLPL